MKLHVLASVAGLLFIFVTSAGAQGDLATRAAACSGISDSLARLICFDKIFPANVANAVGPSPDALPKAPISRTWEVEASTSAVDDSPSVVAALMPKSATGTGFGTPSLVVVLRCVENTTSVVLSTSMFMTEENVPVTIRLDDRPAAKTSWGRSTNYKALGLWNGTTAIPFIRELASASRLVVRVEERDRVDGEFELGEIREVAEQVAKACNWTLNQ